MPSSALILDNSTYVRTQQLLVPLCLESVQLIQHLISTSLVPHQYLISTPSTTLIIQISPYVRTHQLLVPLCLQSVQLIQHLRRRLQQAVGDGVEVAGDWERFNRLPLQPVNHERLVSISLTRTST